MLITHKIQMDIQRFGIMPYLDVVCGDAYTRQLELTLFSGGAEWPVPEGVSAMVRYSRSDGHGGLYDTLPDGKAACSIDKNVVTAILAPQVLSAPGFAKVSVALVKDEQILGLFPVGINVKADPSQNVIPAENYYNYPSIGAINEAIVALENRVNELEQGGNDSSQNGNYVQTVNGIEPDENGNVNTSAPTDEQVAEAVSDYLVRNPVEVSGGIPIPSTAEVGQTIVVKAVDDNGKPTEWEATGFPESGGGATPYYKVASMTTEEEVTSVEIPLSADAIAKLNAAEAWLLEIYLDVSGSTNNDAAMGTLTADLFTTWSTNTFFRELGSAVPTTSMAYAGKISITAIYRKGIGGGAPSVLVHKFNTNYGTPSGETKVYSGSRPLTSEKLRVIGSINLPVGTKIALYAVGEFEVIEA